MSRASWLPFERDVSRLLVSRGVPADSAKAIADEVVIACAHYLIGQRHTSPRVTEPIQILNGVMGRFRSAVKVLPNAVDDLRTALTSVPTNVRWGFTTEDRADLECRLQKLIADADAAYRLRAPRPGRRLNVYRHRLEQSIGLALRRNGVRPTTAKAGTFARILEQVHHAVGISERDVHKSVRRACSALKNGDKSQH